MTYPEITDAVTRNCIARQLRVWRNELAKCQIEIEKYPAFSAQRAIEIAHAAMYSGRIAGMRIAMRIIGE